jgi:hypothetical protein
VLNIGDMRVMEVYVYNPCIWMIFFFILPQLWGINGCILDFHPSMHIIVLKSKTHRFGKIQDIRK